MTRHETSQHTSPISVQLRCSCGWSRQITRKQNALARAAKVKAAWREHDRDIEREIERSQKLIGSVIGAVQCAACDTPLVFDGKCHNVFCPSVWPDPGEGDISGASAHTPALCTPTENKGE